MADKPTITPELIQRINAYARTPQGGGGGALHIVLADENVRDSDVQWCIEQAQREGDTEGEALARILRAMSRSQRLRIARRDDVDLYPMPGDAEVEVRVRPGARMWRWDNGRLVDLDGNPAPDSVVQVITHEAPWAGDTP